MGVVELLAKFLNKPTREIKIFLTSAARKYKVYSIPKRTHGRRVIAQPSKELKRYQRVFLDQCKLPAHSCAMAYRKGLSIKDNANAHRRQRYLLKMDLENFFNSIDPPLFWDALEACRDALPEQFYQEKHIMEQLLFWCPSKKPGGKLVLSVGAPTSPMVSNFCLYNFDVQLADYCTENGITYTRYADDLTFSTNQEKILSQVPSKVRKILYGLFGNKITINHAKTAFSSMAHNRHVTGITLSNDGLLSLGRDRKRYIKHLVHVFRNGLLANEDIGHLRGLLTYAQHIEPTFIRALEKKYGRSMLEKIKEA